VDLSSQLIQALQTAQHIMVLTGAGISAESGLSTFRTPQSGLWERFKPEDLATPGAFERDPQLVWGWYEWRRMQALRAKPNAAHLALKSLEDKIPRLTLVTQNVDDLHERAGSQSVVHLHGLLTRPYCEECHRTHSLGSHAPEEPEGGRRLDPPRCDHCGARIRPGVVWFGEMLPAAEWAVAQRAAADCDVFLCVGTSAVVQPAASLIDVAFKRGAVTIQVNPNSTGVQSRLSYDLRETAGAVLPALVQRV
jgi:NAD-dependent deacetylase